ncbi:MAG TPA: putative maltokinase, partial [Synergistales bacterium]|nr:putative maltokinase [Synergistales bacterium]
FLGDRDGVRTPMQWSPDRNAGFSKANPQTLYLPLITDPNFHYQVINVENQESNPSSLLWWMRRSIAIRRRYKAFSRGDFSLVKSDNPRVVAFTRTYEDQILLIVANLSRFSQVVNMELRDLQGYLPEELSSGNTFLQVSERPYTITMGPHGYFAFQILSSGKPSTISEREPLKIIRTSFSWRGFLSDAEKELLESDILPAYVMGSKWFFSKHRKIRRISIDNIVRIPVEGDFVHLSCIKVQYPLGSSDMFLLPLSIAQGEKGQEILNLYPEAAIAEVFLGENRGILYDGSYDTKFHRFLYKFLSRKRKIRGKECDMYSLPSRDLRSIQDESVPESKVLEGYRKNTCIVYDENILVKIFRKLEEGINPDSEMNGYLAQRAHFQHIPLYGGGLELHLKEGEQYTLAIAQGFCRNQGEMWHYTLNALESYFENVLTRKEMPLYPDLKAGAVPWPPSGGLSYEVKELVGEFFLELIQLLGVCTAQMHLALSLEPEDPSFSPEPFSRLYQRSLYQAMRAVAKKTLRLLRDNLPGMPSEKREEASVLLEKEDLILSLMRRITLKKIDTLKIRIHGDFHLGQVLFTGKDFIMIDFEGETERNLSERRIKRCPFRDVAGMLRSFHNALETVALKRFALRHDETDVLIPWMDLWFFAIGSQYLAAYLETLKDSPLVPRSNEDTQMLLESYVLEKGLFELFHELNNGMESPEIPIRGILALLENRSVQ